jgi:N-acetylmuramoyl-L-alanine amidase
MSRDIERIVVHCSDSPNGRPTTLMDIDAWHRDRGFKRMATWRSMHNAYLTSIGYHYVIYVGGKTFTGRHEDEIGAHVEGYNATSIGICLIGCDAFSAGQWKALKNLVEKLQAKHTAAIVLGHTNLNPAKTCPNFNVDQWMQAGRKPLADHLYTPEKSNA